jgi:hypothetical protein
MPHFAKLISPPVATVLMARNIYLPSIVSGIIIVSCTVFSRLAKNLDQAYNTKPTEAGQSREPLLINNHQNHVRRSSDNRSASESPNDPTPAPATAPNSQADTRPINTPLASTLHHYKNIAAWVRREPQLVFGALAFFLKSNAMASEAFAFQYLSQKFGWPLPNTTVLRFALSFGAVITTLVIGPAATAILAHKGVATPRIDLGIIHVSLLALVVFFVVAWQAGSSTVFILCMCSRRTPSRYTGLIIKAMLGAGLCESLEPTLQGLLSALVLTEEMGSLFALMYTCSLLGDMTGGPLMFTLMSIGRNENSASDGYCFLASAVCFPLQ